MVGSALNSLIWLGAISASLIWVSNGDATRNFVEGCRAGRWRTTRSLGGPELGRAVDVGSIPHMRGALERLTCRTSHVMGIPGAALRPSTPERYLVIVLESRAQSLMFALGMKAYGD